MTKLYFFVTMLLLSQGLLASPQCLTEKNPCNPDLLCTFKAEWHSKVFLYIAAIVNDPSRKGKKPKDGYYYDGNLYESSMAQARAQNPTADLATLKKIAGPIFEDKLEVFVMSTFEMPTCDLNGKLDDVHRTSEGYKGMFTDADCKIWVNYYDQQYDPTTFGQGGTTCEEFYARDYAHEQIHKKACLKMKAKGQSARLFSIDNIVKEEAAAYKHSMKMSEAQYRFLMAQCSDKIPNQEKTRQQLKNINRLLQGFDSRGSL